MKIEIKPENAMGEGFLIQYAKGRPCGLNSGGDSRRRVSECGPGGGGGRHGFCGVGVWWWE